jgi:anionic cell wall polymer biosynthesis LytR-Cps2A-Psr (LCP) family protein
MRTTISDSDVLMLATIDFEKKTVDLISVPRDIPTRPSIIRRDAGKSTPRSQRAAAPKATASNTP